MTVKSLFTFLSVLTLSLNVFAAEVQEEAKIAITEPIKLSRGNSPDTHLTRPIVNSHAIAQAPAEKPNEFLTALSVYLIIIIVYSIYGFRANAKNIEN